MRNRVPQPDLDRGKKENVGQKLFMIFAVSYVRKPSSAN